LFLFRKNRAVVYLLHCFPFTCQLFLNVYNHVIPVPFASHIDVLNQSVPYLANFNPTKDLSNLGLFNSIATFLELGKLLMDHIPFILNYCNPLFSLFVLWINWFNSHLCLF